jgi:hypothetical protein
MATIITFKPDQKAFQKAWVEFCKKQMENKK